MKWNDIRTIMNKKRMSSSMREPLKKVTAKETLVSYVKSVKSAVVLLAVVLVLGISYLVFAAFNGTLLGGCPAGTEVSPITGQCVVVITLPICTDAQADGNYYPTSYWDDYAAQRPGYIFDFVSDPSVCIYCDPGKVWDGSADACVVPVDVCPTTTMYNGVVDPKTVGDQSVFPTSGGVTYTEEGRLCGIFGCKVTGDRNYSSNATIHRSSMCAGGGETGDIDVCPNIDGIQTEVPEGYYIFRDGDCLVSYDWCTNIPGWTQQVLPVSSMPGVVYQRIKFQCRAFACPTSPLVGQYDTISGTTIVIEPDTTGTVSCGGGPKTGNYDEV